MTTLAERHEVLEANMAQAAKAMQADPRSNEKLKSFLAAVNAYNALTPFVIGAQTGAD